MIGFYFGSPSCTRTNDTVSCGARQKTSLKRRFSVDRCAILPRSSCHRQRSVTMQLTASGCLYKLSLTEFNLERKNKDVQKNVSIFGSPSWTRTNDTAVNSRVLYRLSYGGILKPTKQSLIGYLCRHRPIFPGRFQPSIFGTNELNYRVQNGNGWTLIVINTD